MYIALYVVLGISIVVDLALGAWASVAWGSFASTWFADASYMSSREPALMGTVLGLVLIFFATLQGFAFWSIRGDRDSGFHIVNLFGGYLIVSSLITFLVFRGATFLPMDGLEFLLIDGLRGAILLTLSLVAMNEPATVKSLRLPKERSSSADRGRPERHSRGRGSGSRDDRRGGRRNRSSREPRRSRDSAPAEARDSSRSRSGRDADERSGRRRRSSGAGGQSRRRVQNRTRSPQEMLGPSNAMRSRQRDQRD